MDKAAVVSIIGFIAYVIYCILEEYAGPDLGFLKGVMFVLSFLGILITFK